MTVQTIKPGNNNTNFILNLFKKDIVFTLSLLLALISCVFSMPRIDYIDFKVLICLFNLMVAVKAFEELRILDKVAVSILNKCTDSRRVSLILILLSFFASMLVTNDVALITFIPLTLIIRAKSGINVLDTIILQTLAANIGSSLTPMGNPQNLFIFSFYHLTPGEFFTTIIFFAVSGIIWLYLLNSRNHCIKLDLELDTVHVGDNAKTGIWIALFGVIILSVFEIIDYRVAFALTLAAAFLINRKLLLKVDYLLLVTFVCFFIFIGNVSNITLISSYMKEPLGNDIFTYFSSIVLSQFISNVPCSIFLSKFTHHWKELLLGVNIGGMGTIIASLASVISYKLFIKECPDLNKAYLIRFSAYNLISLGMFTLINYFIIAS